MQLHPAPLVPGDLIYICAPAKAIEEETVLFAKNWLEDKGYRVEVSPNCLGSHGYFSGTVYERTADFQAGLDREDVKAILCARGGYGSIQLMEHLQWAGFLREPKWIAGFSDITVFHQYLALSEVPSIHSTMPLNFEANTPESLETLLAAWSGVSYEITANGHDKNKEGEVEAEVIGGNLSILYSLLGSKQRPSYKGKILYIEDVGEQAYAIDRMLFAFKDAGIWDEVSGLIVGSFTSIGETQNPTNLDYKTTLLEHFQFRNIPIAFDFRAGHQDDNCAIKLGTVACLKVTKNVTKLMFL